MEASARAVARPTCRVVYTCVFNAALNLRVERRSDNHGNTSQFERAVRYAIENGAEAFIVGGDVSPKCQYSSVEDYYGTMEREQREWLRGEWAAVMGRLRDAGIPGYVIVGNGDVSANYDLHLRHQAAGLYTLIDCRRVPLLKRRARTPADGARASASVAAAPGAPGSAASAAAEASLLLEDSGLEIVGYPFVPFSGSTMKDFEKHDDDTFTPPPTDVEESLYMRSLRDHADRSMRRLGRSLGACVHSTHVPLPGEGELSVTRPARDFARPEGLSRHWAPFRYTPALAAVDSIARDLTLPVFTAELPRDEGAKKPGIARLSETRGVCGGGGGGGGGDGVAAGGGGEGELGEPVGVPDSSTTPSPDAITPWDAKKFVRAGALFPETYTVRGALAASPAFAPELAPAFEPTPVEAPLRRTVFIAHAPPYHTAVDVTGGREFPGSFAIRRFIEAFQPLASFHGHIHEAAEVSGRFAQRLGATVVFTSANDPLYTVDGRPFFSIGGPREDGSQHVQPHPKRTEVPTGRRVSLIDVDLFDMVGTMKRVVA